MKKILPLLIIGAIILAAAGGGFYLLKNRKAKISQSTDTTTNPAPSGSSSQNPISQTESVPTLVYPLDNFAARIMANDFGVYYPPGGTTNPDKKVCPNATYYVGYHTADDLEIFPNELNLPVIAKSIADGTVRETSSVTGYGGLIVIEYNLGGSIYTAYYGHVNLSTTAVKVGDRVVAGENLAELGAQCSNTNGNVRKHLHFGLHKESGIDVRGYVPTKSDLSNWVDPKVLLASLGAQ